MANAILPRWRFWIDRGGTFTDVVGRAVPTVRLVTQSSCCRENPEQLPRRRWPASATSWAWRRGEPVPAAPDRTR
ncbi:hypothetical protein ACU4GD_08975 [Cupriavidus basilensis]